MAWKINWIEKLSKNSIGYQDGYVAWAEVSGTTGTKYLYLTDYGALAGGTGVPDGVRRKVKERMIALVNKPTKKPTAKKTVKKKAAPSEKNRSYGENMAQASQKKQASYLVEIITPNTTKYKAQSSVTAARKIARTFTSHDTRCILYKEGSMFAYTEHSSPPNVFITENGLIWLIKADGNLNKKKWFV